MKFYKLLCQLARLRLAPSKFYTPYWDAMLVRLAKSVTNSKIGFLISTAVPILTSVPTSDASVKNSKSVNTGKSASERRLANQIAFIVS